MWLRKALSLLESDNNKAVILSQQKRELGLAKQTCAGLKVCFTSVLSSRVGLSTGQTEH
jgi:hypothetical protein